MKKYLIKTTLGVLFTFGIVFGQTAYDAVHITENEEGFGTRALAMGGAYTALADDYSGIYWNPAGLGSIEKTGGSNTRVSVPHMSSTVPLKKNESPTVTIITVSTG